ncbi:hypothetical protein ACIQPP_39060 [Streptomyces violaceusniger]|uniref:hypothetical protein n=1 Tax=Streptomyces violaceusniger TaxID=68280 RepID=UPI00131D8624|nr:hypothetical protein [Streptomyces hygroscopicus]
MPRQLAEQGAASLFGQAGDAANHQGAGQRRAGADRQARPASDLIGRDFTAERPGTLKGVFIGGRWLTWGFVILRVWA